MTGSFSLFCYPLGSTGLILVGNRKTSSGSLVTRVAGHLLLQFYHGEKSLYHYYGSIIPIPMLQSYC